MFCGCFWTRHVFALFLAIELFWYPFFICSNILVLSLETCSKLQLLILMNRPSSKNIPILRYQESQGEVCKHLKFNLRTQPIKRGYKVMDIDPILPSLLVQGVGREKENKDTVKCHHCSFCWVAFVFCYSIKPWAACSEKCQFCTELQWRKIRGHLQTNSKSVCCCCSSKSSHIKLIFKDKMWH